MGQEDEKQRDFCGGGGVCGRGMGGGLGRAHFVTRLLLQIESSSPDSRLLHIALLFNNFKKLFSLVTFKLKY